MRNNLLTREVDWKQLTTTDDRSTLSWWFGLCEEERVSPIAPGLPDETEVTSSNWTNSRAPGLPRWSIILNKSSLSQADSVTWWFSLCVEERVSTIAPGLPDETEVTTSNWTISRAPGLPRWTILLNKSSLSQADSLTHCVQIVLQFGGPKSHNWARSEWPRKTQPSCLKPEVTEV